MRSKVQPEDEEEPGAPALHVEEPDRDDGGKEAPREPVLGSSPRYNYIGR